MPKLIIMLLCIATLIAVPYNTANANDYTTDKSKVISIDPFDLLIQGRLNATYEVKMGAKNSFTLGAFYWSYSNYWSAMGVGGSYRWYIDPFEENKKSLNGLSIGPRVDISWWTYDAPGLSSESKPTIAIGGEIAYKWAFEKKWAVEPIFKFGVPFVKPDWGGWSPNAWGLGVNLGYAF